MTTILFIDNYDSFSYNLVHYLGISGAKCTVVRNDAITVAEADAMAPDAIVISPGPCSPNEAGVCCALIDALGPKIPILGVCLGHQAIGQVFGAKVVRAPQPVHGKVEDIVHDGKDLFDGLPNPTRATRYHSLVLQPETIPDALVVSAWTHDGIVMGVRHKSYPVCGVQFHPESIASDDGLDLIKNFLRNVVKTRGQSVSNP